jgi:hypothetical protein
MNCGLRQDSISRTTAVDEGILTKYHMRKKILIYMLGVSKVPSPQLSIEEDISFVLSRSSPLHSPLQFLSDL